MVVPHNFLFHVMVVPHNFLFHSGVLESLLDEQFTVKSISCMLSVSERTICRRMQDYGLQCRKFSEINNLELDTEIKKTCEKFQNCGEKMFKELLHGKGINVTRIRLRDSLHRVDEGLKRRRKRRLSRQVGLQCKRSQSAMANQHKS